MGMQFLVVIFRITSPPQTQDKTHLPFGHLEMFYIYHPIYGYIMLYCVILGIVWNWISNINIDSPCSPNPWKGPFKKHPAPCNSRPRLRRPRGMLWLFRPFSISISSRVKKDDDVLIMMTIWSQWIFSYLFTALGNNAPSLDMMKTGEIGANISAWWIMWFCQRGCRSSQCPHNWVDECKLNMS